MNIKQNDFIQIPVQMLKWDVQPRALLLYGILLKYSFKGVKEAYPTNIHLAKQLDVDSRSINNYLKELEEHNAIKIRFDDDNKNLRWITCLILNEVPILSSSSNSCFDKL